MDVSHYTNTFYARRRGSDVSLFEAASSSQVFHAEWSDTGDGSGHLSYPDVASCPGWPTDVTAKLTDGLNFLPGDGDVGVKLELTLSVTPLFEKEEP
jgi:hypothetical protein